MTDADIDALPAVRRARVIARQFYHDPAPKEGATHDAPKTEAAPADVPTLFPHLVPTEAGRPAVS